MHIVQCLHDTGLWLNLVNRTLVTQSRTQRIQSGSLPKLRAPAKQPLHVEGNIFLHVLFAKTDVKKRVFFNVQWLFGRSSSICVVVCFEVVSNLGVYMLIGTSFVDGFICDKFPSKGNVVPWHSRTVAIISTNHHLKMKS